jgi:uncharacterized membrane protein
MKNWLRIAGLIAFLAAARGAWAADVSGTWKGAFDFQGSSVPLTIHLTVAGTDVTGTVEGLPTTPVDIHEGKADGSTVTFWVNTDYEGQTYKLVFKGTLSTAGDEAAFTLGTEDGSWSAPMAAKRDAVAAAPSTSDVTGNWKGAFDFNGDSVPLVFKLKSAAGVVTGTVEGLETSPAEILEGKIEGDTVSFWLNTDYQGQTYKLVYKGKVTADQIKFSFGTEDGSWGTDMTASKSL